MIWDKQSVKERYKNELDLKVKQGVAPFNECVTRIEEIISMINNLHCKRT